MVARSSFILSKAFKQFLIASILTALTSQICSTCDAIIVGNMVNPDALSAVSIAMPICAIFGAIYSLLAMGAHLLAARQIGNQNFEKARCIFTIAIVSTIFFELLISAIAYTFNDSIVGLICKKDNIAHLLASYLKVYYFCVPIFALSAVLHMFVSVDGKPKLVTQAIVVMSILNILLDFFFVKIYGISGSAMATGLAFTGSTIMLIAKLRKQETTFHLVRNINKQEATKQLANNVAEGAPLSIPSLVSSLMIYLLNAIILKVQGEQGIFAWSVCFNIMSIGMMVLLGTTSSIMSIGSVLIGEQDYNGLRMLFYKAIRLVGVSLLAFLFVTLLFPDVLAMAFGAKGEYVLSASHAIRIFSLCLLPISFIAMVAPLYQLLGYKLLCVILSIGQFAFLVASVYIFSIFMPEQLWWGFLVGIMLLLMFERLIVSFKAKKNGILSWCLIPKVPSNPSVNFSVNCNDEGINHSLDSIVQFLEICELPIEMQNRVNICCEEMLTIIAQENEGKDKSHTFDVHVIDNPDNIQVVFKDAGIPFNPIIKIDDSTDSTAADKYLQGGKTRLKLELINRCCQKLEYKFMFGLNVTYMTFNKQVQTQLV